MTPIELIARWRQEAADLRANKKLAACCYMKAEMLELHARMLEDALGQMDIDRDRERWRIYNDANRGENLVMRIAKAFFAREEELESKIKQHIFLIAMARALCGAIRTVYNGTTEEYFVHPTSVKNLKYAIEELDKNAKAGKEKSEANAAGTTVA